jgi:FtsH-binding integral membrane protein
MTSAPGRRTPPVGLLLFLGYAFVILGAIGVSLRWVVDQAISAPVSLPGIVAMVLLAYTIFTITMVLQRKQAARGLALGLATLTIPAVPLLLLGPVPVAAIAPAALGVLLFVGLRRPSVEEWLSEP